MEAPPESEACASQREQAAQQELAAAESRGLLERLRAQLQDLDRFTIRNKARAYAQFDDTTTVIPPNLIVLTALSPFHPVRYLKRLSMELLNALGFDGVEMLMHREVGSWREPGEKFVANFNQLLRGAKCLSFSRRRAVWGLTSTIVVKITVEPYNIDDALNLEYINMTIPNFPAAKLLGCLESGLFTYTFLRRIEGTPLSRIWPSMSYQKKWIIRNQLEALFRWLRSYSQQRTRHYQLIGSFGRCAHRDHTRRNVRTGVYVSQTEWQDCLFRMVPDGEAGRLRSHFGDGYEVVITHGTLHPQKILVTWTDSPGPDKFENLKIVAITGWGQAGWYPAH